jgi:outer membrane immunogenic protein
MRRIHCAAIAAVAVFGFASVASAADLPVKAPVKNVAPLTPTYNWGGFYAGAHVGYLWGSSTVVDNGVVAEANAPTNGVVGGVLGGYNWQQGAFVFGVEGDFGWTNAHGNGAGALPTTTSYLYDVKWTSHVRGRAGYATGPWLLFVAGGLSLADFKLTVLESGPTPMICPMEGGIYAGWSIGGGAEYAFNNRVSGRIEYLYDDFGKKTYLPGFNEAYEAHLTGSTVRGALVIKLGQ